MRKPKAALIYYDNYDLISVLSNEQLGVLFRAVMDYGKLLLRGESVSIDRFRWEYPDMEEGTYGFFAFMADTVRRDAATYREKCANYSAAAQRREEQRRGSAPTSSEPRREESQREEPRQPVRSTRPNSIRIGSDEYNREVARYARELMASPALWERED